MAQESSPVGKLRIGTEESQLARFMQRHQPRYKQPPEQCAQHPDRQ